MPPPSSVPRARYIEPVPWRPLSFGAPIEVHRLRHDGTVILAGTTVLLPPPDSACHCSAITGHNISTSLAPLTSEPTSLRKISFRPSSDCKRREASLSRRHRCVRETPLVDRLDSLSYGQSRWLCLF